MQARPCHRSSERASSSPVPSLGFFIYQVGGSIGATSQDSLGRHLHGTPALVTPVIDGIPHPRVAAPAPTAHLPVQQGRDSGSVG